MYYLHAAIYSSLIIDIAFIKIHSNRLLHRLF